MEVEPGDEIIIKAPHWHQGVDVGDRLGVVISTTGYILVEVYNYENNPVKCFCNEVCKVDKDDDWNEWENEVGYGEWYENIFKP